MTACHPRLQLPRAITRVSEPSPPSALPAAATGSKDALKRVLLGIMVEMNATDDSELDFETCLLPKCRGR